MISTIARPKLLGRSLCFFPPVLQVWNQCICSRILLGSISCKQSFYHPVYLRLSSIIFFHVLFHVLMSLLSFFHKGGNSIFTYPKTWYRPQTDIGFIHLALNVIFEGEGVLNRHHLAQSHPNATLLSSLPVETGRIFDQHIYFQKFHSCDSYENSQGRERDNNSSRGVHVRYNLMIKEE